MTRKEAFLTALRLETPDRVPISPLFHCRYANERYGRSDWRAVFDLHQELGSTHFRGPIGVSFATSGESAYSSESRALEQQGARTVTETIYRGPEGELRAVDVIGMIPHDPLTHKRTEYPVKRIQDWQFVRGYYEDQLARASGPVFETAAEAFDLMAGDGVPSVGIASVYGTLGNWRGMQDLLYDLYDAPDVIDSVRDVMREYSLLCVDAFRASPCEVAWYDICWATGSHMGPEMFERFVAPDVAAVCERVREVPGRFIGLYTLGRIRKLLPAMVEAGAHFVETFEPNEGDISLREAKRAWGRDICVMGNFDSILLARGTPEQCCKEALRCLNEAMEGGGYIMVSGDEVPADAKWENLVAWAETVAEHGKY